MKKEHDHTNERHFKILQITKCEADRMVDDYFCDIKGVDVVQCCPEIEWARKFYDDETLENFRKKLYDLGFETEVIQI
jgi:hypothetical protein